MIPPNPKDYTFNVTELTVSRTGTQQRGRNVGKSFVMGTFKTTLRDGKLATKVFKAFDESFDSGKAISPASQLLDLNQTGVRECYLTGRFVEGRARDPNDPSKGAFQDFKVAFVETVAAHTTRAERRKAEQAAAGDRAWAAEEARLLASMGVDIDE